MSGLVHEGDQREVVLYVRRGSLRCWRAKRHLARLGCHFKVVDCTHDGGLVDAISEVAHREVALPYAFVDHRPVGTYRVIKALCLSGTFARLVRGAL